MMDMHEEMRDLVAAYVLGAVDSNEASQVEQHLVGCVDCRHLEGELHQVAEALPAFVDERDPSPALRSRLMAIVSAEAGEAWVSGAEQIDDARGPRRTEPRETAPPGATEMPDGPPAMPLPLRLTRRQWPPASWPAVAAAVVLVAIGVAAWQLLSPGQVQPTRVYAVKDTGRGTISGQLRYYQSGNRLDLNVHGLRPLTGGSVYELWLIRTRGGRIVSVDGLGAFRPGSDGIGSITLTGYPVPSFQIAGLTVQKSLATTPTLPIVAESQLG